VSPNLSEEGKVMKRTFLAMLMGSFIASIVLLAMSSVQASVPGEPTAVRDMIVPAARSLASLAVQPLSFVDEFEGALDSGWSWVDPNDDCSYSLSEVPGHLRITVPRGGNDLWPPKNYDAPRMLRSISGDFRVETKLIFDPTHDYQGAGLLVWKGEGAYERCVERKYYPNGGGQVIGNRSNVPCTLTTVYLRLTRRGDLFTEQYSADGANWITLSDFDLSLSDPIDIGVFVINEWQDNPISADFDYVRITSLVEVSLPVREDVPINRRHRVPVSVEDDVTGKGLTSLQAVLTYDESVIRPLAVFTDGTMTEGWDGEFNVLPGTSPDTLKIGMATAEDTLKGAGTLFFIEVKPAEGVSVGDNTIFHFESFRFNEDPLVDTQDGTVYIAEPARPFGDVTNNGAVTAYDAAYVLQHTVGLRTLAGEDSTVADVSGRRGISAFDASLILQYVIDKIRMFPVEDGGIPDPTTKSLVAIRTVSIGKIAPQAEGRFSVPIVIDEMAGAVAGEVTLSFEGVDGYVAVRSTELTSDYLLAYNVQDGLIRASFAGAESNVGSGSMLDVVFDEPSVDLFNSLRLDRVVLNEGMIPVRIGGANVEAPKACRLAQNCPNPFNPWTALRYDLPEAGRVRLSLYNVSGQLIRTLVDGERPAGSYSVVWDGTDDAGRNVASGVYLCRMIAGEFGAVRKLVLVR